MQYCRKTHLQGNQKDNHGNDEFYDLIVSVLKGDSLQLGKSISELCFNDTHTEHAHCLCILGYLKGEE